MADIGSEAAAGDPAYISYLLSPHLCDWFFVVGNADLVERERIGVVKKMLLAHSVALRTDMIDYQKDVHVTDTYPDTFKNLLRFVYGYDNTSSLSFEEADNLMNMAEKYLVEPLKAQLAARLIDLLSPENICGLLNNPACCRALELDSAITLILQYETDRVLASPQFTDLSCDGLVKLLEQEVMNIPEIEVWRAAVRWARYRTRSGSSTLRKELEGPAKHVRLCTIDKDTLCDEVFTTGILTGDEMKMICLAKSKAARQPDLLTFSNEIECRKRPLVLPEKRITFEKHIAQSSGNMCVLCILIGKHPIELLPLQFAGLSSSYGFGDESMTYECKGSLTVAHTPVYRTSIEPPVTVRFTRQVVYGKEFTIPLAPGGRNIILQPDSRYLLFMTFSDEITVYYSREDTCYIDEHVRVWVWGSCSNYLLPLKVLRYRPLM